MSSTEFSVRASRLDEGPALTEKGERSVPKGAAVNVFPRERIGCMPGLKGMIEGSR
jgi:hypothetical protein